jgi:phosphinothricin acetyltransferase
VALADNRIVGWVAVSPISDRCVYGGVVENSVYLDADIRGRGVGRLLEKLIASTEAAGAWTIQTGISPGTWRASGYVSESASRSSDAGSGLAS